MTGHFEAKKHGYRQTQDGVVVSFVLHPNDLDASFAIAALGTRYMVAFAEIGDDEKPIRPRNSGVERHGEGGLSTTTPIHAEVAGSNPAGAATTRKPFASLPLVQQIGIRCSDHEFQRFICMLHSECNQALNPTEENAAQLVRQHCKVQSRKEITDDDATGLRWADLERRFKASQTDQRYADVRR